MESDTRVIQLHLILGNRMEKPSWKDQGHSVVTCGEECFKLMTLQCTEVQELTSTQEEADTRLMFHKKQAGSNDRCGKVEEVN